MARSRKCIGLNTVKQLSLLQDFTVNECTSANCDESRKGLWDAVLSRPSALYVLLTTFCLD